MSRQEPFLGFGEFEVEEEAEEEASGSDKGENEEETAKKRGCEAETVPDPGVKKRKMMSEEVLRRIISESATSAAKESAKEFGAIVKSEIQRNNEEVISPLAKRLDALEKRIASSSGGGSSAGGGGGGGGGGFNPYVVQQNSPFIARYLEIKGFVNFENGSGVMDETEAKAAIAEIKGAVDGDGLDWDRTERGLSNVEFKKLVVYFRDPDNSELKNARMSSMASIRGFLQTNKDGWFAIMQQPPQKRVRNGRIGKALGVLAQERERKFFKPEWTTGKIFYKPDNARAQEIARFDDRTGWSVQAEAMRTHTGLEAATFLARVSE